MADLIRRIHSGDPAAFAEVLTSEQDDVYTLCLRCLGPADAEAVCETVFVAAHQELNRVAVDTDLRTFLMKLAVAHIESHPPGGADNLDSLHDRSATTQGLLADLELPFRLAVVMRDILRMSEAHIADVLDLSLGTTRSRIHRGRLTMARGLSPNLDRV